MRYHVEVTLTLIVQASDVRVAHHRVLAEIHNLPRDENVELVSLDVQANAQHDFPGIAFPPARAESTNEPSPEELNRRTVEALERIAGKKENWEPGDSRDDAR